MKTKLAMIFFVLLLLIACAIRKPINVTENIDTAFSEEIEWSKAKGIILAGAVEILSQTHDRKVILGLKDGSRFTITELALDDIFKIVDNAAQSVRI